MNTLANAEISEPGFGLQEAEKCCKRGYELSVYNPYPGEDPNAEKKHAYVMSTPIILSAGQASIFGGRFKDGMTVGVLQLIKDDVTVGASSAEFSFAEREIVEKTAKKICAAICRYAKDNEGEKYEFRPPSVKTKSKITSLMPGIRGFEDMKKKQPADSVVSKKVPPTATEKSEEEAKAPEVVGEVKEAPATDDVIQTAHKRSFIGRRATKDGLFIGPIALFGPMNNVSITMSRSIGDRYAARSCICVPDITEVIVSPDEHARFIIASDGLWDVMTTQRAAMLIKNVADPLKASLLLAVKARSIREYRAMKIDDITVLVIDVNPEFQKAVTMSVGTGCGCTIS
jgi:hypothetical protein